MKTAQIHRFGDCVAIYLADGETVYLTPADAKRIAKYLNAAAKDCKESRFVASDFVTSIIPLVNVGCSGRDFEIVRG